MAEFSFADEYAAHGDDLLGKIFPEGEYTMRVQKATPHETAAGKQAFKVVLEFVGGPYAGKTVPDQLTYSPENEIAVRIFAQSLGVLGATPDWIKSNRPSNDQIATRITGQKVAVKLTEDEWNGQKRNNIRYNKNLGGPAKAESLEEPDADTGAEAEELDDASSDWP